MTHSRREFFARFGKLAVAGAAATLTPNLLVQPAEASLPNFRALTFYHTHTNKELHIVYKMGKKYVNDALHTLNSYMRDPNTGDICRMDPKLYDILFLLHQRLGSNEPIQIVSAYRSPQTNRQMRRSGHRGVAKRSLHMEGRAIDFRMPDIRLKSVRNAAIAARLGGVGYYPHDNFVHVDTGVVRHW